MPYMARIDPFASPSRNTSVKMQSLFHDSSPDFGPVKYEVNKVGRLQTHGTEVLLHFV